MQMSKEEIIMQYEQAKSKNLQIKILAQLNDCPPREIKKILNEAGLLENNNPKPTKCPNEAEKCPSEDKKRPLPDSVKKAIFIRLNVLEGDIKNYELIEKDARKKREEREAEYTELANYIKD